MAADCSLDTGTDPDGHRHPNRCRGHGLERMIRRMLRSKIPRLAISSVARWSYDQWAGMGSDDKSWSLGGCAPTSVMATSWRRQWTPRLRATPQWVAYLHRRGSVLILEHRILRQWPPVPQRHTPVPRLEHPQEPSHCRCPAPTTPAPGRPRIDHTVPRAQPGQPNFVTRGVSQPPSGYLDDPDRISFRDSLGTPVLEHTLLRSVLGTRRRRGREYSRGPTWTGPAPKLSMPIHDCRRWTTMFYTPQGPFWASRRVAIPSAMLPLPCNTGSVRS